AAGRDKMSQSSLSCTTLVRASITRIAANRQSVCHPGENDRRHARRSGPWRRHPACKRLSGCVFEGRGASPEGKGAVFKRVGFLLERRGGPAELIAACRERLSAGNARLDPAISCRRLVKRWRLWIPASWAESRPQ